MELDLLAHPATYAHRVDASAACAVRELAARIDDESGLALYALALYQALVIEHPHLQEDLHVVRQFCTWCEHSGDAGTLRTFLCEELSSERATRVLSRDGRDVYDVVFGSPDTLYDVIASARDGFEWLDVAKDDADVIDDLVLQTGVCDGVTGVSRDLAVDMQALVSLKRRLPEVRASPRDVRLALRKHVSRLRDLHEYPLRTQDLLVELARRGDASAIAAAAPDEVSARRACRIAGFDGYPRLLECDHAYIALAKRRDEEDVDGNAAFEVESVSSCSQLRACVYDWQLEELLTHNSEAVYTPRIRDPDFDGDGGRVLAACTLLGSSEHIEWLQNVFRDPNVFKRKKSAVKRLASRGGSRVRAVALHEDPIKVLSQLASVAGDFKTAVEISALIKYLTSDESAKPSDVLLGATLRRLATTHDVEFLKKACTKIDTTQLLKKLLFDAEMQVCDRCSAVRVVVGFVDDDEELRAFATSRSVLVHLERGECVSELRERGRAESLGESDAREDDIAEAVRRASSDDFDYESVRALCAAGDAFDAEILRRGLYALESHADALRIRRAFPDAPPTAALVDGDGDRVRRVAFGLLDERTYDDFLPLVDLNEDAHLECLKPRDCGDAALRALRLQHTALPPGVALCLFYPASNVFFLDEVFNTSRVVSRSDTRLLRRHLARCGLYPVEEGVEDGEVDEEEAAEEEDDAWDELEDADEEDAGSAWGDSDGAGDDASAGEEPVDAWGELEYEDADAAEEPVDADAWGEAEESAGADEPVADEEDAAERAPAAASDEEIDADAWGEEPPADDVGEPVADEVDADEPVADEPLEVGAGEDLADAWRDDDQNSALDHSVWNGDDTLLHSSPTQQDQTARLNRRLLVSAAADEELDTAGLEVVEVSGWSSNDEGAPEASAAGATAAEARSRARRRLAEARAARAAKRDTT